jgi:hypothetical protein
MTSVLYSGGLNYQSGNPVRAEIVAVRREVSELRKQLETLTEENSILRKFLLKLLRDNNDETSMNELTHELMKLTTSSQQPQPPQPGIGTIQGGGFRR